MPWNIPAASSAAVVVVVVVVGVGVDLSVIPIEAGGLWS
jgi:hypothetical protein